MTGEQGAEGIKELTAWLEADDAKGRAIRAKRLRDLLDILPVPSDGLSFLGGEASAICFHEVRRCYLDGSDMAVVLLSLAYVERELAAQLYAAGWEDAKHAPMRAVLERAYEDGVLSEFGWRTYRELAHLRNSHAHFRAPGSPTSMMARVVEENALASEVLAKDARRAVQAMAAMVERQSGRGWHWVHRTNRWMVFFHHLIARYQIAAAWGASLHFSGSCRHGRPSDLCEPAFGPASPEGGADGAEILPVSRLVGRDRARGRP